MHLTSADIKVTDDNQVLMLAMAYVSGVVHTHAWRRWWQQRNWRS